MFEQGTISPSHPGSSHVAYQSEPSWYHWLEICYLTKLITGEGYSLMTVDWQWALTHIPSLSLNVSRLKVTMYCAVLMRAVILKTFISGCERLHVLDCGFAVTRASCNYRTPTDGCSEWSDTSLGWINRARSVHEAKILQATGPWSWQVGFNNEEHEHNLPPAPLFVLYVEVVCLLYKIF